MFEGHPLIFTAQLEASQVELTVLHKRNGAFFDLTRGGRRCWEWDSYFLMQHHGAPTRLLAFRTDPHWLPEEFAKAHPHIKRITIEANYISEIRIQLRESGVTESVIFRISMV